jgi:hypothetical protein
VRCAFDARRARVAGGGDADKTCEISFQKESVHFMESMWLGSCGHVDSIVRTGAAAIWVANTDSACARDQLGWLRNQAHAAGPCRIMTIRHRHVRLESLLSVASSRGIDNVQCHSNPPNASPAPSSQRSGKRGGVEKGKLIGVQDTKEKLDSQMAETRSKLRHEEDRLHEVQTQVLSLEARVAEKAAELERPARAHAADALLERRSERDQTSADLRSVDQQLKALRMVLAKQRGEMQAEQEKLQDALADAVCPHMPCLGCGLQIVWSCADVVAADAVPIARRAALIV